MKYWLCTYLGESIDSQEQYEEVYPCLGALFVGKNNEEPPCTHIDDKWVEISKEEYEKAMDDPNHIIKYDGFHCIGKCTECKNWIKNKHICNETDKVITNPGVFKNCCVFDD